GIQGISAALIASTAFSIAISSFPASYRGRVVGIVTMASSLGLTIGVFFSSLALGAVSWRAGFLLTGGVAFLVSIPVRRLTAARTAEDRRPFDVAGSLLLGGGLTAAFLSLSHAHDGPETFQAGAPWHLSMNTVAVVLIVLFVWWERRQRF